MDISNLKGFREEIFNFLPDKSAAILFSGNLINNQRGNEYEFEVNRNFYYLTGIEQEESIVVFLKNGNTLTSKLFLLEDDEVSAKWVGHKLSKEEAKKISGIEDILYVEEYEKYLHSLINKEVIDTIYMCCDNLLPNEEETLENKKYFDYKKRFPFIQIKDIKSHIHSLRERKTDFEVECVAHAGKINKLAFEQAMRIIKPGVNEFEVKAILDYIPAKHGLKKSFETIVASGNNATILHYDKAKDELRDGELVLMDSGCTFNYYSSDVTRTVPVSGKFSLRQRELYSIVLCANKAVIEKARAGVTIRQLNDLVIDIYNKELLAMELLNDDNDVSDFYYHNVSHHIGLMCHDPVDLDKPLVEGNIISVEPGLYIAGENIGIRIEDDILITQNGCKLLTADIIKEIAEIEEFMDNWEVK